MWVRPRPLARSARRGGAKCSWQALHLSAEELNRKTSALQAHKTQYGYCREYLDSFLATDELYGDFRPARLGRESEAALSLGTDNGAPAIEPADELEDDERARFVGVESHTARLSTDTLELTISLSWPLGREVSASFYIFGYRLLTGSLPRCPSYTLRLAKCTTVSPTRGKHCPQGTPS